MANLDEDIDIAIKRCNDSYILGQAFSSVYVYPTENIKGFINHFDLYGKSLFTVGSSGEQVINAHLCGAKEITLYDINPYAGYFVWLKIAAIYSLSYEEYQEFFFKYTGNKIFDTNWKRFNLQLFGKISPVLKELNEEAYLFWLGVLSKVKSFRHLQAILNDEEARVQVIKGYSLYLDNKKNYNKAKKVIRDIVVKFVHGNIFEDQIDGNFDNIFLSNISTYCSQEELLELIKKLDNNLNPDGRMLFAYLYETKFDELVDSEEDLPIYRINFVKKYFKEYLNEHASFLNSLSIMWHTDDKTDLALIYHKK